MLTDLPLPGLDRLIAVCQRHSLPLKLLPPVPTAPRQGEAVLGDPLDPQLAATYERLGGAQLGPVSLLRPALEEVGLIPWNERLRRHGTAQFCASLIFGEKTGFPLYFATVPRLASAQGLQPVVYIEAVDILTCVPVASSVDHFFGTYSRYLDLMVVDPEYLLSGVPAASFPWGVPHLFSQDAALAEYIRSGHFDFLTQEDEEANHWLRQLGAVWP